MSAPQFCSSSIEFEHLTTNVYTTNELFAQTEALRSLVSHFLLCRNIFVTLYLFFLKANNKPYYKGSFSKKNKTTLSLVFVYWDSEMVGEEKEKGWMDPPAKTKCLTWAWIPLWLRDLCQESRPSGT